MAQIPPKVIQFQLDPTSDGTQITVLLSDGSLWKKRRKRGVVTWKPLIPDIQKSLPYFTKNAQGIWEEKPLVPPVPLSTKFKDKFSYVTFGHGHSHTFTDIVQTNPGPASITVDHNCVVKFKCSNSGQSRLTAISLFGCEYAFEYYDDKFDHDDVGRYYSRGIIELILDPRTGEVTGWNIDQETPK